MAGPFNFQTSVTNASDGTLRFVKEAAHPARTHWNPDAWGDLAPGASSGDNSLYAASAGMARIRGGVMFALIDSDGQDTGNELYFYYWLTGTTATVEVYFYGDGREAPSLQISEQDASGEWGDDNELAVNTTTSWTVEDGGAGVRFEVLTVA